MTVEVGAVPARARPFFLLFFFRCPRRSLLVSSLKGGTGHGANMDKGGRLEFDIQWPELLLLPDAGKQRYRCISSPLS